MVQQSLGIELDNNSIKYAQKRITELKRDFRDFSATVKASEPIAGKLGDTLRGAFSTHTSKRIAEIADNTRTYKDETLKALRATEQLNKAQTARVQDRFKSATEQQGDISTTFSALGSLAGGSEAASLISDLTGVAEYLPRFADAIKGIPDAARTAVDNLGKGGVGLVGALGLLTVALAFLQAQAQATAAAARADLDARERAIDLIRDGNREAIQARIDELEAQKRINAERVADAENTVNQLRQSIVQEGGLLGTQALGLAELGLGANGGILTAAKEQLTEYTTALGESNTELNLLTQGLGSNEVALNDATAAQERYTSALVATIQQQIATQTQINAIIREGTSEQVRARIAANLDEQAVIVASIAELQKLALTSEDAQKALAQASDRLNQLSQDTGRLQSEILPLVDAREQELKAVKDQEQRLKDLAGATDKYNKDIKALEDAANQSRAASAERLNDALVKAAESAAEAAESALAKLQEKRGDLAADFAQDSANAAKQANLEQLDAQINLQREEARARREHARTLLQIQKDAAKQERDFIDARDFAGLFNLRQDTQDRLNEANQSFNDEQAERRIAYAEQLSDLATAYQREREQRAAQFQQDLNDAAIQYQREQKQIEANRNKALIAANNAYNREIQLANDKYNREIAQRQQAISAELSLIQQGGQARIALEAQIQKALVQQAYNILAGVGGSGGKSGYSGGLKKPTASAFGNNLAAMQPSTVNELPGQRERFAGQLLPGGAGMLIPLRGGRVSPGASGGINVSMPITINAGGGNAQQIAGAMNAIKPQMKEFIIDTLAEVVGA